MGFRIEYFLPKIVILTLKIIIITLRVLADIELNILSSESLHTSFDTPAIRAISTYVIFVRGIAPLIPLTSVGRIPDWCCWPTLRGFPLGRNYFDITNKGFLSCLSLSLGLVVPYCIKIFSKNSLLLQISRLLMR